MSYQTDINRQTLKEVSHSVLLTAFQKTSYLSASINYKTITSSKSVSLKMFPVSTEKFHKIAVSQSLLASEDSKITLLIDEGTNYLKYFLQTIFGSVHILMFLFFFFFK